MVSELRKAILEAEDIESEVVHVSQWDVDVEIRGMTGSERGRFMKAVSLANGGGEPDFEKFYAQLIIATAYEPGGEKLFEPADRDALNQKSGAALNTLAEVSMRLSGLAGDAVEAAQADFD